jgi:alpha-D-xyloside xylohydrolase
MGRELREMGVEPIGSIWPTVDVASRNRAALEERGLLVRALRGPNEGLCLCTPTQHIDPTNPETRSWVWGRIRETYRSYGFRSFWLDLAEPETCTPDTDNFSYAAGTASQAGNIYPREYERLFWEGLRADGETEIVSLARSAWAGSQKFGALLWSGDIPSDWWALRNQVAIGLSAGMAGIPWWNCDIGGFFGGDARTPEFRELLARWFAFGVFTPVMRLHGNRDPQEPGPGTTGSGAWGSGAPNEVWSYGPEMQEILVAHIRLRERLRPYLRELFREASETGAPLMRPLFWHYPDDQAVRDVSDQYLFGRDLLVAPVLEQGATSRKVVLPAGDNWADIRTGERLEGGRVIEAPAPLSSIPVFVRDGASGALSGTFPVHIL